MEYLERLEEKETTLNPTEKNLMPGGILQTACSEDD